MIAWVAALPVLLATLLLAGLRWPAARAMPACGAVTAVTALAYWRVPGWRVLAASAEAVAITISVLLILFGALFLVEQLRAAGAIRAIERALESLSPDPRIQVVLVAWLLGSFFEGASGFGAPPAITAPLLVALGFPSVLAVVLALAGDSVAVSFGAVGTPMLVGMAQGLEGAPGPVPAVGAIARRIALNDLFVGSLVPVLLVLTLTVGVGGRRGVLPGLRAAPFALVIGAVHLLAAAGVAYAIGPELPSLVGPLPGMLAALVLLRRGWLIPRDGWSPAFRATPRAEGAEPSPVGIGLALTPYALLVALLALTRTRELGLGPLLASVAVGWRDLFGTNINAQLQPLYSPCALFVAVTLLVPRLFRLPVTSLVTSARASLAKLRLAALPLLAAILTVRLFVHSGENAAGLPAMPIVLADVAASAAGDRWHLVAPWVGALGAFIAGSATFSNLLFAGLQQTIAGLHAHDPVDILALQGMGAAAGNIACIHNVVAASSVVGLVRAEGDVIRRAAPAMLAYLLCTSALGWLRAMASS